MLTVCICFHIFLLSISADGDVHISGVVGWFGCRFLVQSALNYNHSSSVFSFNLIVESVISSGVDVAHCFPITAEHSIVWLKCIFSLLPGPQACIITSVSGQG